MSVDIKTQEQLFFSHPTCLRKHFRLDSSLNTHASHVGFLTKPNTTFRSAESRAVPLLFERLAHKIVSHDLEDIAHIANLLPAYRVKLQDLEKNSSQEQEQLSTVAEIIKKCFNTKGDNLKNENLDQYRLLDSRGKASATQA